MPAWSAGKPEEEIRAGLESAATTRKQLEVLDAYAGSAGAEKIDLSPYEDLIELLNDGAHGRAARSATLAECRQWVRESRQFAAEIRGLSG